MSSLQTTYKKSSFGPAFFFLDKKRREALAVYYAFCRLMDDIADEPQVQNRLQELQFWQEEITRVYEKQAQTPLGKELEKLVQDFSLPQDRFVLLIEGMKADVQGKNYKTFEELEWYLWRVAGIVGLATLDILGVVGEKAQNLARSLGFAVQITNIIRDVWEDVQVGRVYLPEDMLSAHHITRQQVLDRSAGNNITKVLSELAGKANDLYQQADAIMRALPKKQSLPCYIMGFVYRQNLAKIKETGFSFERQIKLSKFEKIKYSIYALFYTIFIG